MYNEINFNSENLKRAFEKCAEKRPLVRLGEYSDDALASYEVLRSDMRTWCIVEFIRSPRGHALGKCDCPAGEIGWYCYHLAAALTVHIGLVRHGLRKPISRSIWTPISDEFWQEGLDEIDEGAEFSAPSMLPESFDSGNYSLLADFSLTSKFYPDKHRAVCVLWERKFCLPAKAAHPIGFARASLLKRQTNA